jgi:DNA repair exonuclease SbcCD ATPase subunit
VKIVSLEASNVKILKAISIHPDGNIVELTGENGQGKTSILDAIFWALTGTSHIQASPIRLGAEEAFINLDLGRLKVTRRFKAKDGGYTTSLIVESEDGAQFKTSQNILNALVGGLTFDPLEFTNMKPEQQFDTLKAFVPGVDFDAIEKANKADFDERTDVNRQAKVLKAQAVAIVVPDGTPDEPIDESALVSELEHAGERSAEIERHKADRERAARGVENLRAAARRARDRAAALRIEADKFDIDADADERTAGEQEALLLAMPVIENPPDTSVILSKIEQARRINAAVKEGVGKKKLVVDIAKLEAESERLTMAMRDRDEKKRKAVASAQMPVDGISFGDKAVYLNGVPFDQGSGAERLRASIAIAMAMNPKLRIILVKDGALLSPKSFQILQELANERDFQIWVETVVSDRPSALVIEDGMVRETAVAAE